MIAFPPGIYSFRIVIRINAIKSLNRINQPVIIMVTQWG